MRGGRALRTGVVIAAGAGLGGGVACGGAEPAPVVAPAPLDVPPVNRGGGEEVARPSSSGAAPVDGSFSSAAVQRVVRGAQPKIRLCYEQALHRTPTLTGRMTTGFSIGADGRVTKAQIELTDITDAPMVACVVRVFAGLEFPPPETPKADIRYPLVFKPKTP